MDDDVVVFVFVEDNAAEVEAFVVLPSVAIPAVLAVAAVAVVVV